MQDLVSELCHSHNSITRAPAGWTRTVSPLIGNIFVNISVEREDQGCREREVPGLSDWRLERNDHIDHILP